MPGTNSPTTAREGGIVQGEPGEAESGLCSEAARH